MNLHSLSEQGSLLDCDYSDDFTTVEILQELSLTPIIIQDFESTYSDELVFQTYNYVDGFQYEGNAITFYVDPPETGNRT